MSFLELSILSDNFLASCGINELTFWYASFTIITEKWIFPTIAFKDFTVFNYVWTIFLKWFIFSTHAIKLSSITKRRKYVWYTCFFIKHFLWNTSPSFCVPKAKVITKIKWEITPEKFKSYNLIRSSRTKNWCCNLHSRKTIKTNIYNFICIQQGTCLWFIITRIGVANICQIICFFSTYQQVIFNGYLGVQVPTAFSVSVFYKKVLVLISPWNAIHLAWIIIIKQAIKDNIWNELLQFQEHGCSIQGRKKFIFYLQAITLFKIKNAFVGFWTNPRLMISPPGTIFSKIDIFKSIHANFWRRITYWAKVVGAFATVTCQSQRRIFH